MDNQANKDLWDSKAGDEFMSKDKIGTELEIRAISCYVKPGMRVLDAGCGNGRTVGKLREGCEEATFFGIDSSPRMIQIADESLGGKIFFLCRDVLEDLSDLGTFDLIYSQLCLINLSSWEEQLKAIQNLISLLKPGGHFVMCENSFDALCEINKVREMVGLYAIQMPWWDHYFEDRLLYHYAVEGADLKGVENFMSTYYYLSRIVNAYIAKQKGVEPDYDSSINQLALYLPGDLVEGFSQTKLWIWEKI